ncbi:GHMP family kinase ATP-binding protein [Methanopyrus sp.]
MRISVPGALTGFFHPRPGKTPRDTGSPGFGLAVDTVVIVRVRRLRAGRLRVRADHPIDSRIARKCYEVLDPDGGLSVRYEFSVPPGCGLGTSAASALGTLAAGAAEMGLEVSPEWIARRAYEIELELGTGIGDVVTIWHGGAVLRVGPGYPDEVPTRRIPVEPGLRVLIYEPRPIETREALDGLSGTEVAFRYLKELERRPDLKLALRRSLEFAERLGFSEEVELAKELSRRHLGASIAMLSRTVFAVSREHDPLADVELPVSYSPFPEIISGIFESSVNGD